MNCKRHVLLQFPIVHSVRVQEFDPYLAGFAECSARREIEEANAKPLVVTRHDQMRSVSRSDRQLCPSAYREGDLSFNCILYFHLYSQNS